jgi:hypothetical protein
LAVKNINKMKIRATLIIDIETDIEGDECSEGTLRYLVEDDLSDSNLNYTVYSCVVANER